MKQLKVLLVDDHKVVRDGIRYMLDLQDNYEFTIDEAESGEEAVEKYKLFGYDVVIMDINMEGMDGIEACETITAFDPEANILALSMYEEGPYVKKMLSAGAKGYVLKNAGTEELKNALKSLLKGERYYSSAVAMKLIEPFHDELISNTAGVPGAPADELLSKREMEILELIAKEELTNQQISKRLSISKRTVDSHRQNILNKTNAKNTVGLIKYAVKNGIVDH